MPHIVRVFDTFTEAAGFARHTAKQRGVELTIGQVDARWHVVAATPLEIPDHDELEARLSEKDAEAVALQRQMASLRQQLREVAAEKEAFRIRVIQHEAKPTSAVSEALSHTHTRKSLAEPTCEACGRTLTFCRCAG